jgi:LysR family transcriptional regulator, glycine cleavage system transcriptional activator
VTARSQLPLKALLAFEVFARTGRMTLAAQELCVTHGAVSKMIKELQTTLGVKLVEGQRSNLKVNAVGLEFAKSLTFGFDHIVTSVANLHADGRVQLKVSCLGTFAMRWLIPRLPRFYATNPSIAIKLRESHAPVDLIRDGDDAAIRMADIQTVSLPHMPFLREYSGPVMAPSLALGLDPQIEPIVAVQAMSRLGTRTWPEGWRRWETSVSALPNSSSTTTEFDHTFYMLAAAAAGLGVAIGSWALVEDDIKEGGLVAPLGFQNTNVSYILVRNPHCNNRAVQAFAEWLVEEGKAANTPAARMVC